MSADFEKVLVKDPRLDVSDSIKYAVIKGGQNVTAATFPAISESDSQIVWNIQVPSEQTIIDRRVIWQSTLTVQVGTVDASGGECYGVSWALAPFPLHQLLSVMSVTINNNTVSINISDVLPAILRLICQDDLLFWNNGSPTFNDTQAYYPPKNATTASVYGNASSIAANGNNPLSGLYNCTNGRVPHRGCFAPVNVTSGGLYTFQLWEPVLLSPFIYTKCMSNGQGFYGIQNMNFVFNKQSSSIQQRVVRGNTQTASSVSTTGGGSTVSSSLLFMFLTPHPSDLMPARNIVPFYELPRYLTNINGVGAASLAGGYTGMYSAAINNVALNTLQLNQIPDKLILYVRNVPTPSVSLTNPANALNAQPDVAFPIGTININFNNNSGILASAKPIQLWEMSRANGLQSSWIEYSGIGATVFTDPANSGGNSNISASASAFVGTVGSYLVLEFGKDIQLTEDFYAPGSLGNFNLQITLTQVYNNTQNSIGQSSGTPPLQVVLITMNSGVFVCERGTSSTYTGILTKQDVLEASQQEAYTHNDVQRLVGGGLFDMIKSGVSKLAKKGKEHLKKHGAEYANKAMSMGKDALSKYIK